MSEKYMQAVENMEFTDRIGSGGKKIPASLFKAVLMSMAMMADEDGAYGEYTLRPVAMCPDGRWRFVGWETAVPGKPFDVPFGTSFPS